MINYKNIRDELFVKGPSLHHSSYILSVIS
jgi:hypothetical protein